jgi:hypothetical protein
MSLNLNVGLKNSTGKYLTAETFGFAINVNGASLKKKQTFTIEFAADGAVYLKRWGPQVFFSVFFLAALARRKNRTLLPFALLTFELSFFFLLLLLLNSSLGRYIGLEGLLESACVLGGCVFLFCFSFSLGFDVGGVAWQGGLAAKDVRSLRAEQGRKISGGAEDVSANPNNFAFKYETFPDGRWAFKNVGNNLYFGGAAEKLDCYSKEASADRIWTVVLAIHPQ